MWILADDLDLIGDLWVDLPLVVVGPGDLHVAIDTRTTIERADSSLTFALRDLVYDVEIGWRTRRARTGVVLGPTLGQRGRERVDADGQPWVRWLGATIGSPGASPLLPFPARRRAVAGWATLGAVFDERETEADAVLRGATRWRPAARKSSWARRWYLDARLDGLVDGTDLEADFEIGPGLDFDVGDRSRVGFFLRYLHADNPLGAGTSGMLLGFEYEGEPAGPVGAVAARPAIDGVVGTGWGEDGRLAAQLLLRFLSPAFLHRYHGVARVDANVLTAEDTGDLFYLWEVGIERSLDLGVAGVYLYHRSNHELAEPNETITSLNVIDFGIASPNADRPGARRPRSRGGSIDGSAHAGVLLDSSFGEDRRWHVRGSARWSLPLGPRIEPYLRAEVEAGDVERAAVAIGASVSPACDLEVQFRTDDQYASDDRELVLALARYAF